MTGAASGETPPRARRVGRYGLYAAIAAGGVATVHLGRLGGAGGFRKTVAIKSLHPHFANDPDFLSMFLDEARVASRVQHPNVVSVLDVIAEDGELLVVMEYVAGESLARLLREAKQKQIPLPVRVAVTIAANMLYGLHAAHEAKNEQGEALAIVHRDVSPQNVMLGPEGVVKIVDFGIAKAVGRMHTTRNETLKGHLAYMSPEQLERTPLDRRADIYATSIVLWEMLTGRRLFAAEDEVSTFRKALEAHVVAPHLLNTDVSLDLSAVVMKGLEREPSDRYQTAETMAAALEGAVPLAEQRELAEWVVRVAAESLAKRAADVARMEQADVLDAESQAAPDSELRRAQAARLDSHLRHARAQLLESEAPTSILPSSADFDRGMDRPAKPRSPRWWVATGMGALALLLFVLWGARRGGSVDARGVATGLAATTSAAAAVPPPLVPLPSPGTPAQEDIRVATPTSALVEGAPSPTTTSSVASPSRLRSAPPIRRTPKTVGPSEPQSGQDCREPFVVDAAGVKIPKQHCL